MEKNNLSFEFKGKFYHSFRDYGVAIAREYYPLLEVPKQNAARYLFTRFHYILDGLNTDALKTPSVAAAYNYCREYYATIETRRMNTSMLLDEYISVHENVGKLLTYKYRESAIIISISRARGF